ncbi:MAG: DUF2807 domain-containing protein [Elusimicrobiaceae bacterium]|nr:DUF2807 domain-containing protein [Elusimicrobiaceae bacterium]
MKKIMWFVFLCTCALNIHAKPLIVTGSDQHRGKEIGPVAAFTGLSVSGQTEVDFQQIEDENYTVSLFGPNNLVDLVEVKSEGGALFIHYKEPVVVVGDHHLRVLVLAPSLAHIEVKEQGEVQVVGSLNVTELTIWADGKTEVEIDALQANTVKIHTQGDAEVDVGELTCQFLHIETADKSSVDAQRLSCEQVHALAHNRSDISISGLTGNSVVAETKQAAEIELKGKTDSASLTARDRSEVKASTLQANNADVMAGNSAHIGVRVEGTLNAQTEKRGVVEYRGWPREINRSGKGLVRKNS